MFVLVGGWCVLFGLFVGGWCYLFGSASRNPILGTQRYLPTRCNVYAKAEAEAKAMQRAEAEAKAAVTF